MDTEVAETSGVTSDDTSPPGLATLGGDAAAAAAEGSVDARPSTADDEEEDARCSSQQPTDPDSPRAPQTPLAFTIDFGDNREVDTARYQNLFERYNARHRRNLSTSKVLWTRRMSRALTDI